MPHDQILFLPNRVRVGNQEIAFVELVKLAYLARIQLSAAGFYKTPKIHWNRDKGEGRPFYYFAYGAACSEVSIDTLTGEYVVERTDILHDTGRSLNRALDIGQIEGGFIQGMGWLTTEELVWDEKGRLRTHAPSTYKIPLASDRPKIFNVRLADWPEAFEPTVHRSKAVGEPPFPLGMSVLHALSDAVASVAGHRVCRASMHRPRPSACSWLSSACASRRQRRRRRRSALCSFDDRRTATLSGKIAWLCAGRGRLRAGIDPARGRGDHAGVAGRHNRHHRRRAARIHGHREGPRDAGQSCRRGANGRSAWARDRQCCGGRVALRILPVDGALAHSLIKQSERAEALLPQVLVFGGGHVGHALAAALALLPARTTVVETRPDALEGIARASPSGSRPCRRRWSAMRRQARPSWC